MFTLDRKVGLFVPTTGENGDDIGTRQINDRVHLVHCKLSGIFGGCTSLPPGIGSYSSDTGGIIVEHSILVLSWCTQEAYDDHYYRHLVWASYLARIWYQETIGILDNDLNMHLVSEEDYIREGTSTIVSPGDFLELLPDINPDRALIYWENGYSVAGAQYEEDTRKETIQ